VNSTFGRFEALVLEGGIVRLEPLREEHTDELWEVGRDPELWRLTVSIVRSREDMQAWVRTALAEQAAGRALPFVTRLRQEGRIVGSTRFGEYAPRHGRVEIGWTWIARPWQRTAVNTEAKLLMMRHAFETLALNRVELKTDALNAASRRAILRLGAKEEGVLRRHAIADDGRVRDTVYYSILREEWPAVRERLEGMLGRPRAGPSA
jgi:RimJ/RimL family protein N-acetyltransferase